MKLFFVVLIGSEAAAALPEHCEPARENWTPQWTWFIENPPPPPPRVHAGLTKNETAALAQ